jgi:hypothetical protein
MWLYTICYSLGQVSIVQEVVISKHTEVPPNQHYEFMFAISDLYQSDVNIMLWLNYNNSYWPFVAGQRAYSDSS